MCQQRVVHTGVIHLHTHLPQIRAARNGRYRAGGEALGQGVHHRPPERHLRTLAGQAAEGARPAGVRRCRQIVLALLGAGLVELDGVEAHVDDRDARKGDHNIADVDMRLDAGQRQHALVALVGAFPANFQPLTHHNGHEGHREQPCIRDHVPDPVVDDPAEEGEVILQVVIGHEGHAAPPVRK